MMAALLPKTICHLRLNQTIRSLRHLQSPPTFSQFFSTMTRQRVLSTSRLLTVLSVPSHQLGMLFVSEQTFQPWYYRSIPHHLGRNPLPGALTVNITRVISSDLLPQCTTYRACVQIPIRIAVHDAVIRACMYLLHLQS